MERDTEFTIKKHIGRHGKPTTYVVMTAGLTMEVPEHVGEILVSAVLKTTTEILVQWRVSCGQGSRGKK